LVHYRGGTLDTKGTTGENFEYDLIVIGSGSAGLTAALSVAEGGAQVIIFEKMDIAGGSSNIPSGPFAVESKLQRRKYIGLTRDEAFRIIMEYSHWRANPRLARAFVDKSADTIDWLERQGVEFIEPVAMWPDGLRTWHLIAGRGAALVSALVAKAQKKGVELRLGTMVKKIVMDGEHIAGVLIEDKSGKTEQIKGKAVMIATGGYGGNKEMIKKYTGFDLGQTIFERLSFNLTGDGIRMAWDAGAAEEGLGISTLQYSIPGPGISETMLPVVQRQPYLWINKQGRRFCDESTTANWPFAANALIRQKPAYAYLIFDGGTKKYLEEKGIDNGALDLPPATKIDNLDKDIHSALAKGNENLFMANSFEEMGNKIGIDANTLQENVDEYNESCDRSHDGLFAKDPRYLQPVRKPVFYAFRLFPTYMVTLGGIKINEKTEVLNKDGDVIPGLYAGGNDAGGLYGDSYDLYLPGTTSAFALNTGRIAGENILKYIEK
jgi:fumarate reductase flavoprotein subunit